MAANKDKDKKSGGGHSSSNGGVGGGTSIHKSTKSVTFADRNESTSPTPKTQIAAHISSTIPPQQQPQSKNTNRNLHDYHHRQPHYHNSNNSSSAESTTEDSSGSGAEDNYSSLSDQLDNLAEPSTSACDTSDSATIRIYELPENVIENIFSYLPLRDLRTVSFVCTDWARIINNENNEIWRSHCLTKLHPDALRSPTLLTGLLTFKSKLRAFHHAWNPNDCSRNIFVKPNGFTIHRNPVAQSTDGVRGKVGFTRGRHAWEVIWEGPLGTVAVVGIATRGAEMRAQGYVPLLGQDEQSWGWNLVENTLLHNGDSQGNYPVINNAPRYQVGERIRVILDCEDSTLSFEKDNEFYGVAFRGLPSTEPLYPAISAVYGNTEVSMVYLGPPLDG